MDEDNNLYVRHTRNNHENEENHITSCQWYEEK